MKEITPRQIAQGCRCQILTGFYKEATRSCDCVFGITCHLDKELRQKLSTHPKIIKALKRNKREFDKNV